MIAGGNVNFHGEKQGQTALKYSEEILTKNNVCPEYWVGALVM